MSALPAVERDQIRDPPEGTRPRHLENALEYFVEDVHPALAERSNHRVAIMIRSGLSLNN